MGSLDEMESLILHPLDQIAPRCYIRSLFCFPLRTSPEQCVSGLQDSLNRTIAQNPLLAGTVRTSAADDGCLHLTYRRHTTSKTVKVKHFPDFDQTYETLRDQGMPMRSLPLSFGPFHDFRPNLSSPVEVFGMQANFIPGGLILAIYTYHAVIDGIGCALVVKELAQNCNICTFNGEQALIDFHEAFDVARPAWACDQQNEKSTQISGYYVYDIDATEQNTTSKETITGDRPLITIHEPPRPNKVNTIIFSLNSLANLKLSLNNHLAQNIPPDGAHHTWVSTYDTLVALMWSGITRARFSAKVAAGFVPESLETTTSQLIYPTDVRDQLSLPPAYLHNGGIRTLTTAISVPSLAQAQDNVPELAFLAHLIRQTTSSVTPGHVSSILQLISSLPSPLALHRPANTHIPLSGAFDLLFTSWYRLSFYDHSWGEDLGKPEYVRVCPHVPAGWDGLGYILPPRWNAKGEQEVEVVLGLKSDAMEALRQDASFMRWVTEMVE